MALIKLKKFACFKIILKFQIKPNLDLYNYVTNFYKRKIPLTNYREKVTIRKGFDGEPININDDACTHNKGKD